MHDAQWTERFGDPVKDVYGTRQRDRPAAGLRWPTDDDYNIRRTGHGPDYTGNFFSITAAPARWAADRDRNLILTRS